MAFFNKKKESVAETDQEQESKKLVDKVKKLYNDANNAKSALYETWKTNHDIYTGKYYAEKKRKDYISINHVFATVETIKPIMLNNPPKAIVLPKREEYFDKALMVQNALDYEWRRTRMFQKLVNSCTYALLYGTVIYGLFWNSEASNGLGEIEMKVISPFNFFIDPSASTIDEAEYVMYATYKSLGSMIKAYPEKADELKRYATNNIDENLMYGNDVKDNIKNQLLTIECYMRDYAIDTTIENIEINGETKIKETKSMKYPNGRKVIIAGDVLLYDGENPYEDGSFPFTEWKCYPLPSQFWGISEVEMLAQPQEAMADLTNALITNAKLTSNAPWILDKNSGVEKNSLTNSPGLVIRKTPGSEVRRENPPSMPAYISDVIHNLKYDIQVVSGVFDATRGERPVSITAGTAIQALQESSQGRIRLKVQEMEVCLAELNSMWLKRIQQYWVVPRMIRVMQGQYTPNMGEQQIQQQSQLVPVSRDEIDGDYDIEIMTGSSMAVNRSARLEQLIRLAQTPAEDGLPMVDRKTLLSYTELDNVDQIIKTFEAEKQAQQQQQQQQMQMQQQMQLQQQGANLDGEKQKILLNNLTNPSSVGNQSETVNKGNKSSLQNGNKPVQSKVGGLDIQTLLEQLDKLSPQELKIVLAKNPEILALLKQLSEQSSQGNSQGGI